MICKQDVLLWFETLDSYKRIETMYSLLTACLPFELRFLGTLLEEQGRCDSEKLRGMELRANNPHELAADMLTCQKGDPTDIKHRRKMALYLALIRACNRNCVAEIFRTLECWGESDFSCINDQDTLLELLLVYTMAAIHPVFSLDEQRKLNVILAKIKENKLMAEKLNSQQQQQQQQQQPTMYPPSQHQQHLQLHQMAQPQPPPPHPQIMQMVQTPQGTIPMIFSQHFPKLLPSTDGTHQINAIEAMSHMMQSNITIPTDASAMWPIRHYAHPPPPQQPQQQQQQQQQQVQIQQQQQNIEHPGQMPPQATSPMLSQQSSPSSSRTTSPQRSLTQQQQQQPQQMRNMSQRMTGGGMKNTRRPSAETTPPPTSSIGGDQQHAKHMDENINDGLTTSLPNLIRNGFQRPGAGHHHRIKANTYIPPHQQQQQQQQQQPHFQPNSNYMNAMQNMNLNDDGSGGSTSMMSIHSNKSTATTGSETGSSNGSCGEISPPETPTPLPLAQMHGQVGAMVTTVLPGGTVMGGYQQKPHHLSYKQQQQLNLQQRLNGRNGVEKSYQQIYPATGTPVSSDAGSGQALLISPSPVNTPTSTVLPLPSAAYNAAAGTYPYHTGSTPRGHPPPQPPQALIQAHTAPPPHGGFRYPMQPPPHNGEQQLLYSAFPGLTFLAPAPAGTPTGAPVTASQLRNTAAVTLSTNAVVTVPATHQPAPQPPPPTAVVSQQSYSALSVCPITGAGAGAATQKIISCYNCGSQTHSGRDCQEASMEDVTRSASYKLDYSEASSTTSEVNTNLSDKQQQQQQADMSNSTVITPTAASAIATGTATAVTSGK
ncbi:uncharacterized protein Dwil_GK27154 [Drosophila willistoni]|uniref:CCHC-type domain-containing protein n=1 Tax=Drosophila willistoni TaxID=7260 RepID=A0A0Q9X1A9_DROWI|nr:ataxin-2 homolog [Drosophila willistoni]KRF98822.1 uncharacterized protein Dwil_GK27154 [Drosophila willistoni]